MLNWFCSHNTAEWSYNLVKFVTILHSALWWKWNNISQILDSQKTPHSLPSRASYGMFLMRILEEIDHVIMASHCSLILPAFYGVVGRNTMDYVHCCLFSFIRKIFRDLTHWGRDKMAAFRRWHFQTHFLQLKCLNFYYSFTEVCS